ncbi:MAG TPA: hypothetical protein VMV90_16090 [Rectinemataceae bacterium]|nr:hypothetical protein [Rectinemataceae bacterium]
MRTSPRGRTEGYALLGALALLLAAAVAVGAALPGLSSALHQAQRLADRAAAQIEERNAAAEGDSAAFARP